MRRGRPLTIIKTDIFISLVLQCVINENCRDPEGEGRVGGRGSGSKVEEEGKVKVR